MLHASSEIDMSPALREGAEIFQSVGIIVHSWDVN